MSIVGDFKSIRRKLDRMEQKEAADTSKQHEPAMYGWPYGLAVPLVDPVTK